MQEPKLSAARRIVSEWTDYDEEMHRLGELIASERAGSANANDKESSEGNSNQKIEL